jgi:hypothetical protein
MTEQDWARIHTDTERAIENMRKAIRLAEVGKKKGKQ